MRISATSFLLIGIALMGYVYSPYSAAQVANMQSADEPTLTLLNLRSMKSELALQQNNRPHVIMFMQPNCSWCKKQAIDLEKLAATCKDTLNTSVLGFNGKRNELRRESRYFADKVPVFAADKQIIRTLGGVTTSPTFIFLNEQRQIVAKQQGYLPPEKLYNAVNILSNAQCKLTS